jgi:hypothetical protein
MQESAMNEYYPMEDEFRNLVVNYTTCKGDCIDLDNNFCPASNRLSGTCCLQGETCKRIDICSNDVKNAYLKLWSCPNSQNCYSTTSLIIIPALEQLPHLPKKEMLFLITLATF